MKKAKVKDQIESLDYSKKIIRDIRLLLWIVTLSGILLAFFCVYRGYIGTLAWITSLVGLPWSAYGTICSFYLNMAKSDHSQGGITYDMAMKQLENDNINLDEGI